MKHNGVPHAGRCACPLCDPAQARLARARAEAREARRLAALAPPLPLAVDRPRRPLTVHVFESAKDRRFKELLRTGIGFTRAADQTEAEFAAGGVPDVDSRGE